MINDTLQELLEYAKFSAQAQTKGGYCLLKGEQSRCELCK